MSIIQGWGSNTSLDRRYFAEEESNRSRVELLSRVRTSTLRTSGLRL